MILNPNSLIIHNLGDVIPSIRDGCHPMKEFGALIAQFYSIYRISFLPV
jgi:hypothetical protein